MLFVQDLFKIVYCFLVFVNDVAILGFCLSQRI